VKRNDKFVELQNRGRKLLEQAQAEEADEERTQGSATVKKFLHHLPGSDTFEEDETLRGPCDLKLPLKASNGRHIHRLLIHHSHGSLQTPVRTGDKSRRTFSRARSLTGTKTIVDENGQRIPQRSSVSEKASDCMYSPFFSLLTLFVKRIQNTTQSEG